eukprot:tig00020909_g15365.t1
MRASYAGLIALCLVTALVAPAFAGCDYFKSCASCVYDTSCGWCGSDPTVGNARTDGALLSFFLDGTNTANFVVSSTSLVGILDAGYAVRVSGIDSDTGVTTNPLKTEVRYVTSVSATGFTVDRPFSQSFNSTKYASWSYSSCPESAPMTGANPQFLGNIMRIQGTVSVTAGSNVVTGSGTEFWLDLRIGWPFMIGDNREVKYVQQITSDTSFIADSVFTSSISTAKLYLGTTTVFGILPPTIATPFLIELLPGYSITAKIVIDGVTYTQTRTIRNVTSDRVLIVDKPFDAPILPSNAANMSIPGTASPMGTSTAIETPLSSICTVADVTPPLTLTSDFDAAANADGTFDGVSGGCAVFSYTTPVMGKALAVPVPGTTTGSQLKTNPVCYNTGRCLDLITGLGTLSVNSFTAATSLTDSTMVGNGIMELSASAANPSWTTATLPMSIMISSSSSFNKFDVFRVTTINSSQIVTVTHAITASVTSSYAVGTTVATGNWRWFAGCPMVSPIKTFNYKSCPVNPGCCGVQIGGSVGQNLWAYYTMTPEYSTVNLRVFAYTIDDNLDMLVQSNAALPASTLYNQTSVRESNPWAIDVPQYSVARNCAPYTSTISGTSATASLPTFSQVSIGVAQGDAVKLLYQPFEADVYPYSYSYAPSSDATGLNYAEYAPSDFIALSSFAGTPNATNPPQTGLDYGLYYNCKDWIFGLRGDNRYPQRTGSSEYSFTLYTEFNYPDFLCQSDRSYYPQTATDGDANNAITKTLASQTFGTGSAAIQALPVSHKSRCQNSGLRASRTMFMISSPKQTIGRGRRDLFTMGTFNNTAALIDLTHPSCQGPVVLVYTIEITVAGTAASANVDGSFGSGLKFKYRVSMCDGAPIKAWSSELSPDTSLNSELHLGKGVVALALTDSALAASDDNFKDFGAKIVFPVTVSDAAWTVGDQFEVYVSIGSENFISFNSLKAVRTIPATVTTRAEVHLDDVQVYGIYTGTDVGTPDSPITFAITITATDATIVTFTYQKSGGSAVTSNNATRGTPVELGSTGIFILFRGSYTLGGTTFDYRIGDVFTITITSPATMRLTTGAPPQFRIGPTQLVRRDSASTASFYATGFYTGSAPTQYRVEVASTTSVKVSKDGSSQATLTLDDDNKVYIGDGLWIVQTPTVNVITALDTYDIRIIGATNGIPAFDTPQVGAVFYKDKMHVSDGFEVNFQVQFTAASMCQGRIDGICDGGNGIAFVLHDDNGAADAAGVATAGLMTTGYGLNDFVVNGTSYSPCSTPDVATTGLPANPSCWDTNDVATTGAVAAGSWKPGVYKYVYTLKITTVDAAGDTFVVKRDADMYRYDTDFLATPYTCAGLSSPVTIIDSIAVACSQTGHTVGDQIEIWTTRPRRTAATTNPVGCAGSGNGFGDRVDPDPRCRDGGIRKGLAVELDVYYDQNQRDPRQGLRHWWINATEIISNQDNHLGVFLTPDPTKYPNHGLSADHSNDAYHFAATPSIPNLNDGLVHTIKLQYFDGFTTSPRQGQGLIYWDACSGATASLYCIIKGNANTKFKSEMKYTDKVVTYITVNYQVASALDAQGDKVKMVVVNTYGDRITADDAMKVRWVPPGCDRQIPIPGTACGAYAAAGTLNLTGTTTGVAKILETAVASASPIPYLVHRDYPGYLTIFVDEMNMFVLRVAIRDDEFAAVTDSNGNSYIGFTGSTGYIHYTQEVLNWSFCNHLGCVPI